MKKTLLALLLAPALMLGACNNGGGESTPTTSSQPTSTTTTTTTPQSEYKAIAVTTFPKTDYIQGEQFTVQGGKLTVTRNDDTTYAVDMTLDMVPDKPNMAITGEDIEVNVAYLGLSCKYYINIAPVGPQKQTPQIYVYENGVSVTNGYVFKQSTGVHITVDVPAGVEYVVEYFQAGEKLPAVPTEVGAFMLKVTTTENDDYFAASKEINFFIKAVPTLVLKANGVALAGGEVFYLSEGAPTITCDCDYDVAVDIYYTKDENDDTINLGAAFPTQAGTYAVNAKANATDTTEEAHVWKVIRVEMVRKTKPVITFYRDGVECDFSDNHWIGGGYAASKYQPNEMPTVTFNVNQAVEYEALYTVTVNDVQQYQGNTLPSPLIAGTYKYEVVTTETDEFESVKNWALWVIDIPTKDRPVINFYRNGTKVNITPSNHWIGGGYAQSQYTPDTLPTITYDTTPAVDYTVKYEIEGVYQGTTLPSPLLEGTYSLRLTTAETDQYESVSEYCLFKVTIPTKGIPVITFLYNGSPVDTSETHWITGAYATSEFYDVPDYGHGIDVDVPFTVSYEKDESPIAELPNPIEVGTYCVRVTTTETAEYESVSDYILFRIVAAPTKQVPTIQFSWNGSPVVIEPTNHWIGEGYGDSQVTKEAFKAGIAFSFLDEEEAPVVLPYDIVFEVDEVPTDLTIDDLVAGTVYAMRVTTEETEQFESVTEYVLVAIVAE